MPARKPSAGLAGVDGVFVVTSSPVSSSRATTSVKVPPVSMPTLIRRRVCMESIQAGRAGRTPPVQTGEMRLVIRGRDLPGASGGGYDRIGVGLQVGSDPVGVVAGDAGTARWETELTVVGDDFRGPAVQGRKGERFVYLTWGDLTGGGFEMFRRAKLMLSRVDTALVAEATGDRSLVADVVLTDEKGQPRCARVDPPAVRWSVEPG